MTVHTVHMMLAVVAWIATAGISYAVGVAVARSTERILRQELVEAADRCTRYERDRAAAKAEAAELRAELAANKTRGDDR